MTRFLRIVVLALCVGAVWSPQAMGLSVSGNQLVDASGQPIRLIGFRNQLLKLRRHARG